ncbi:lectin C-type domain protein [Oesophagostomum dentatum]|uniref:Lectin C-type domain protein n=1 Tax=Oesophagostomum dentatum TaxID=61180 RepID=A0A0B1S543_OESDE|nr:lectin C-type domain protein [Oesophagostomum dentatum]
MEQCYSFNESPMNWADAAKYCYDQGRDLALTESEDDQTFYAGYVQGMLSATQAFTQGVSGVWTSVRSVPNGSEPAWVVVPGSYVVTHQYWQPGEPNIYPSYDEVCVSLQQETMLSKLDVAVL